MELVDEILDGLELNNKSQISILYSPEFAISLIEDYGVDSDQITMFTDGDPLLNKIADKMGINSANKMEELSLKKWDLTLGNPPYGKNANLAIDFLNRSADYADEIVFVMPKTLKKKSAINRVREDLHLVDHVDNPDDAFGVSSGLWTCVQKWKLDKNKKREKIEVYTRGMVKDDFIFTDMKSSNVAIGRVGRGSAGRVFTREDRGPREKAYEDKSPHSHYFIKTRNKKVLQQLKSLESEFREMAQDTVSNPSLSIDDLVSLYVERYMGAK